MPLFITISTVNTTTFSPLQHQKLLLSCIQRYFVFLFPSISQYMFYLASWQITLLLHFHQTLKYMYSTKILHIKRWLQSGCFQIVQMLLTSATAAAAPACARACAGGVCARQDSAAGTVLRHAHKKRALMPSSVCKWTDSSTLCPSEDCVPGFETCWIFEISLIFLKLKPKYTYYIS